MKCVRRRGVLPGRRRELHGEAVLVTISCARTSGALQRSAKLAGRAAQGGRTGHEGFNNPAVASRSYTQQLLRPREEAGG